MRPKEKRCSGHLFKIDILSFVFLKYFIVAALARIAFARFVVGIASGGGGTGLRAPLWVGATAREGAAREDVAAEKGLEEHVGKTYHEEYASEDDDE